MNNYYQHWRLERIRSFERAYSTWMKDKKGIAPSKPDVSLEAFMTANSVRDTIH